MKRVFGSFSAKTKKWVAITAGIIAVLVGAFFLITKVIIPANSYKKAVASLAAGKHEEAIAAFTALNGYKDSQKQITEAWYQQAKALLEAKDYPGAAKIFIGLKGYKDVASLIAADEELSSAARAAYVAKYDVGNTVTFGSYAGESIEWLVLEADGDERVLISERGLEAKPFNNVKTETTWETCSLRKWLNEEFFNTAFSAEEQAQIVTQKVTADKNPECNTNPGNDTEDKVWLLSITEATGYFANENAMVCYPTRHARSSGAWTDGSGACWWWLRTPGSSRRYAAGLRPDGSVSMCGTYVGSDDECVRPAVLLKLF